MLGSNLATDIGRANPPEARILYCRDGLALASLDRLCVGVWRKSSNRERFRAQKTYLSQVVNGSSSGGAYLMVLEPTSDPPDDEIRKASAAMVDELGAKLNSVACVIEGDGFRAAILRTVLSGITFLIRAKTKIKIFGSVESAAAWLCPRLGLASPAQLVRQVEGVRKKLDVDPLTRS